jgi:hypothetical protein
MKKEYAEAEQEEIANPYNSNKLWHTNKKEKVFISSNNVHYDEPETEEEKEGTSSNDNQEPQKEKVTDYKKRYDDLKRHHDSKINEFKEKEKELTALSNKKTPNYQAPKSLEDLENFRKKYPDVYDVVKTVAGLESDEKTKSLTEQISTLRKRETELLAKEAYQRLEKNHPDFDEIKNSDSFHSWAKEQPSVIQDWVYNNESDVDLASRAIDLYKRDLDISNAPAKPSSNKQTRKSAADMVSTKTTSVDPKQSKIWTEREIASMSMDDYDKWEDAINQAITEGRVVKSKR